MYQRNSMFFSFYSQEGGGSAIDSKKNASLQPVVSGLPAERKPAPPTTVPSGQIDEIRTNPCLRKPEK